MFKQDVRTFLGKKTNWLGLGMIGGGLISITNSLNTGGDLSEEAIKSIIAGLALLFVRDGIEGVKKNVSSN